ncbi:hypothetical protein TNCT_393761 [Trichonephila clavata]|uniref:Uncharacterized protein n=1 Tax=Trichonephila clavata TaxID=2740835 RepID=A0A8X6KR45_TRICU|nr:hypothetical protein TNCT_393761 [Trichonephila clavata]
MIVRCRSIHAAVSYADSGGAWKRRSLIARGAPIHIWLGHSIPRRCGKGSLSFLATHSGTRQIIHQNKTFMPEKGAYFPEKAKLSPTPSFDATLEKGTTEIGRRCGVIVWGKSWE